MANFIEFVVDSLPNLLRGTLIGLKIWIICISSGTILGILLALGRIYGNKVIYALCTIYIELFRGTPLLVQIFVIYLGLPDIGIVLTPVLSVSIAIGLNTAAYQAEYFRGAIQSVKGGQMLAARAIGMSKFKAIIYIILPQGLRIVIPQWSNEVILELKMTSLGFAVGATELMAEAKAIGFKTFRYTEVFMLAAFIYLVIVALVSTLLKILEGKARIPGLGSP